MSPHRRLSGLALALGCVAAVSGCTLAPRYARPDAPVPAHFSNAATSAQAAPDPAAMPAWQDVFLDPKLRRVISLALDNNRDLRVAMLDIDKARAQYRIQRAALLPAVDATGQLDRARISDAGSDTGHSQITRSYDAQLGTSSWEIDLFGRLRSLKREQLETWLATGETQRGVRLSLVGEVASDWLAVANAQRQLELARQTLASQQETLKLVAYRHDDGIASGLDLAQVQTSVEGARADVAHQSTALAQAVDALQLVVGTPVDAALLPGAGDFDAGIALAPLPADLPASVLLQRPDVLAAEHALKAANADIGAARAAFFPSLSLTAGAGRSSDALSSLFSAGSRTWSFVPSITAPIFHAGALKASLDASRIGKQISVAQYEKAIQSAFADVADALAERDHLVERMAAQQALVGAAQRAYTLADARYRSGVDGYLQALDAQRTLYAAQRDLISLQAEEAGNRVTLYEVLGGGADAQPATATSGAGAGH